MSHVHSRVWNLLMCLDLSLQAHIQDVPHFETFSQFCNIVLRKQLQSMADQFHSFAAILAELLMEMLNMQSWLSFWKHLRLALFGLVLALRSYWPTLFSLNHKGVILIRCELVVCKVSPLIKLKHLKTQFLSCILLCRALLGTYYYLWWQGDKMQLRASLTTNVYLMLYDLIHGPLIFLIGMWFLRLDDCIWIC